MALINLSYANVIFGEGLQNMFFHTQSYFIVPDNTFHPMMDVISNM